jgi:1,5-anhydro-D-fructose reductase (1,5-anhydro-D-mannitol-forming)
MPEKIKIGIFGAGAMARKHLEAYRDVKYARIAGVAAARPEHLKKIAADFGIRAFADGEALLSEIDAADICLPTFMHEGAACAAAAAGVHAICEKPVALDPRTAARMIAAAKRANTILMIAHCLRFWPEYTFLKDAAVRGSYGGPLSFHGWRYGGLPAWSSRNWLLDEKKSGGPTTDLHIHDADMIFYLFGKPGTVRANEISTKLVRSVSSEFTYPGGMIASADAGWYFPKAYPFSMGYRAVFEKAVIEYQSDRTPRVTIHLPGKAPSHPVLKQTDGYREELRYFVNCIRASCEPSQSSAADALVSLRMVIAAHKSATTGRAERLKY